MSRKQTMFDMFETDKQDTVANLYVANLPDAILANSYMLALTTLVNAVLHVLHENMLANLQPYDITKNL